MRCTACRRPLTNPVSIRHGYGPDCLKKAVAAGNAPLEALEQLTAWKRSQPAKKPSKAEPDMPTRDEHTADLFEAVRAGAIKALHRAAAECERYGVKVTLNFEEQEQA